MPSLDIQSLTVNYAVQGGTLQALAPVNLKMNEGDFVVALGASGCGKTTLLNCIAGFLPPSTGAILLDGEPIAGPGSQRGVVFQKHALMPWLTVRDNVALGLRGFADRAVYELSGGMQQRVGIARALANDPALILADEPTAALDSVRGRQVIDLFRHVADRRGAGVAVVTHDLRSIDRFDRVIELEDGRMLADRRP